MSNTLGFMYFAYENRNAVVRNMMQDLSLVYSYEKMPKPNVVRFR